MMKKAMKDKYVARAGIIKAMAHPTRLFIIDELSKGERCVAELTKMIGADMSTISKHLSVLRGAGIVSSMKRGSQVYYRLRVPCILNFFGCVEAVMKSSLDELARSRNSDGEVDFMSLRSEWKPLSIIAAVFLGFYFLPFDSPRAVNSVSEALLLPATMPAST